MNTREPWRWGPLEGMPAGAEDWALPGQAELETTWARHREALRQDPAKERFMGGWLRERVRAFAIETGQIEGLYTLRRSVTEQLVADSSANRLAERALSGDLDRPNGNGGRTIGDAYHPPLPD